MTKTETVGLVKNNFLWYTEYMQPTNSNNVGLRAGRGIYDARNKILGAPDEWHVYSRHASKGAARSRIRFLRNCQTFRDDSLTWVARRRASDGEDLPYAVYVSVNGKPENVPVWGEKGTEFEQEQVLVHR